MQLRALLDRINVSSKSEVSERSCKLSDCRNKGSKETMTLLSTLRKCLPCRDPDKSTKWRCSSTDFKNIFSFKESLKVSGIIGVWQKECTTLRLIVLLACRIGTGPTMEKRGSVNGVSKVRGIFILFFFLRTRKQEELWQGWENSLS